MAVGAAGATVRPLVTPVAPTAGLGAIGFGAAGPIAGMFLPPTMCGPANDSSEMSG